jgi:hypothetical protein
MAYKQATRPARISQAFGDVAYSAVIRPAKVSTAYIEVMRSLRIPPLRRRGLHLVNDFAVPFE